MSENRSTLLLMQLTTLFDILFGARLASKGA